MRMCANVHLCACGCSLALACSFAAAVLAFTCFPACAYTRVCVGGCAHRLVYIHPNSACVAFATPKCVVFHEVVHTNKPYMRHVTPVSMKWVNKLLPRSVGVDVLRLCGRTAEMAGGKADCCHHARHKHTRTAPPSLPCLCQLEPPPCEPFFFLT